ncbi:hypothetical protein [Siphonobacter sp. SORGH_AS_0500]|uniref:hypothetical protein n=1 Tax=Siphonobacter sp. SORGH_AS_0500 TaxID=1864824 RepID=UPI0028574519|nr:hypothetical protein [Siphonobacter sp. SORGH_AS_0500]MDR6197449.1 hypothetical protein [Siphonobacter sp. SORGH_AS_0500]
MINLSQQISKHLREVYFGGNWTFSNLRDQLADVSWEQATTQVYDLNTIVALTYHVHYYVAAILRVFRGLDINASDKLSFDHPPIQSSEDWENLVNKIWIDVDALAELVLQMPEEAWQKTFVDEKYGTYYRNLHGMIEHTHYHLGQIVLIKKVLRNSKP